MYSHVHLLILINFVLFLQKTYYLRIDSHFKMSDKTLKVFIIFIFVIINLQILHSVTISPRSTF